MKKVVPLSEVFIRAKELMTPETYFKDRVFPGHHGGLDKVSDNVAKAQQFCAYGAVYKAQHELGVLPQGLTHRQMELGKTPATELLEKAFHAMPDSIDAKSAAVYSNTKGPEAVNKMFCKAIEFAVEDELKEEASQHDPS